MQSVLLLLLLLLLPAEMTGSRSGGQQRAESSECSIYQDIAAGCDLSGADSHRCSTALSRLSSCSAWRGEIAANVSRISKGMPGCPVSSEGSCETRRAVSYFAKRPMVLHVLNDAMDWIHFDARAALDCPAKCLWAGQAHGNAAGAVIFDCLQAPSREMLMERQRQPEGERVPWVFMCMESDVNVKRMQDKKFMAVFDVAATYHLSSSVPLTYAPGNHSLYAYGLGPAKERGRPLALWVASNCAAGRMQLVEQLMSLVKIHSFGKCLKNADWVEDEAVFGSAKIPLFSRFKFALSFENSIAQDYVTEKFYHPLIAGSVPIYLGAPNVASFAPSPNSYIDIRDFETLEQLADRLAYLDGNDTAYDEMQAWREKPLGEEFRRQASLAFNQGVYYGERDMRQDPCRVCLSVHEAAARAAHLPLSTF